MKRALAHLVTFAVAIAVWLIALPAFAGTSAAPQCDSRGATTFAPAPTLQAPLASIDVGPDDDAAECAAQALLAAYHRGDGSSSRTASDGPEATIPRAAIIVPAVSTGELPRAESVGRALSGVARTLERPPRV